ncbi:PIG-L family deacetylase [Sphaerisporangium sp. NPDC005289]|uniref:PIG-L deacetylase family protein n=1 Tax=Sphaerisporangium sp. NPDC005289 TaxID=3155247 RepID=UPI0033B4A10A
MRAEPAAGETVIVFAPHPDDEVIACGGVIAARAAAGARVLIVFSTDGSRSHSAVLGIDSDPTPAELAVIRRKEAESAAKALGVPAENVVWLGHTDTRLAASMDAFRAQVTRLLAGHRDVAEVYLPHDVRELNADHRLTGEGVTGCLAGLGLSPRLRKYVVWDEDTEAAFAFANRAEPEREPSPTERLVSVDIAPWVARKLDALEEHRTQVTLFSPAQTRTVVPEPFLARLRAKRTEDFWIDEPEEDA